MQYVSTRGAAPTLGFADALLAGLARDGGLYVPLSVPHLPPDAIRALRGVPYPEAAARIMAPFVEKDFGSDEMKFAVRGRLCRFPSRRDRAAYANRRQPVHARTFPRTNAGVQGFRHAMAGTGDEPRFATARRPGDDHWSDLGRHRRCGDRGFRRAVPGRSVHPLSAGPGVGRAAPADDDGQSVQRPRARDRRLVRRLSAHRQGAVRRSRFSRRDASVGRQFHQLGADPGADRLLFRRRRCARRARAADILRRSDRQFRRRAGRLLRQAHGAADRAFDRRDQRERHSRAHAGHRTLCAKGGQGDPVAVDGHSGVLELRAPPVRGLRPRAEGKWSRR